MTSSAEHALPRDPGRLKAAATNCILEQGQALVPAIEALGTIQPTSELDSVAAGEIVALLRARNRQG